MAKSRGRKFAELIAPSNGVFAAASLPTIALSKLASSTFSVNSESASLGGNVVLDSNDITEHTSALYFTNARADTRADARIAAHNLLARAGGTMTGNLTLGDNVNVYFGASTDLRIYHDGTNSHIINSTGELRFTGSNFAIKSDSAKLYLGVSDDLQIYHDGSNSYVKDAGTGQLILQGSTKVILKGVNGDNFLQGNEDGAVNLYHNDLQKLATTSAGIAITGNGDFSGEILVGTQNSRFAENNLRFLSSGHAYLDHSTTGQSFIFRVSNSSSLDTTALTLSSSGYVTISNAFTLPNSDGSANQVLQTNGSGTVSWGSPAGSGTITAVVAGTNLTGGATSGSATVNLATNLSGLGTISSGAITSASLHINGSTDQKILLSGSADPYIRWQEGSTNKGYLQWNAAGYFELRNQETTANFRLGNDFKLYPATDAGFIIERSGSPNVYQVIVNTSTTGTHSYLQLSTYNSSSAQNHGYLIKNAAQNAGNGLGNNSLYLWNQTNEVEIIPAGTIANRFTVETNGNVTIRGSAATIGGNTAWHAGNDGTGSGLDADLLDGLQSDIYFKSYTNNNGGWSQSGRNFSVRTGGDAVGLHMEESDGTFGFQLYGNGSQYGFLDAEWAGWDIQKTTNGELYIDAGSGLKKVWHAGNDGSGSGLDADTVDGIQGASFLRSDVHDTGVGLTINGGTLNSPTDSTLYVTASNNNDWGITIGATSGKTEYGMQIQMPSSFNYALRILKNGSEHFNVNSTGATIGGNYIWHAGNDGAASGLDADLLDGYQLDGATSVATRIFNNKGQTHSTYTNFNTVMTPGPNYLQAGTNGPTGVGTHQFYGIMFGLGSDYATSTGTSNNFASQMYYNRAGQGGNPYLYFRDMESGTWGSWRKVYAAYADDADNLDGRTWSATRNAANTLITRDANGYAQLGWINTTSGSTTGTINKIYASSDDYIRYVTPATLISQISAENGGGTIHRLASNGYSQLQNWTNVAGSGIYSTTVNGFHFYPNVLGSYGCARLNGSRGGYSGFLLDSGGDVVTGMYDGAGNGGDWSSASSWHFYWHRGNGCLAVAGSSTSGSYGLYEQGGGIYSTGNVVAYSDRRVKENIVPIDNALEKVNKLAGVYYNRIDDEKKSREIGFIAQDVNEVTPELVTYAEDVDQYGVKYQNATALLVEAVKELTQQVNDLKAEIKELKNA